VKIETFDLELDTPCFRGGAEPDKQAEIRAPSIHGSAPLVALRSQWRHL
jgi:hypothetical protein